MVITHQRLVVRLANADRARAGLTQFISYDEFVAAGSAAAARTVAQAPMGGRGGLTSSCSATHATSTAAPQKCRLTIADLDEKKSGMVIQLNRSSCTAQCPCEWKHILCHMHTR